MDSQVPRRLSFLKGNDGLASLVNMDVDCSSGSQNQKNPANFFTRPFTYVKHTFKNVAPMFTVFPPSEPIERYDLRKPFIQKACCRCRKRFKPDKDIFMYNDGQYCTAECRQVQLDIDFPPPHNENKKDDPSLSTSPSPSKKRKSAPATNV